MNAHAIEPEAVTALLTQLALLVLMAGGFALMLGLRNWAGRLLLLGILISGVSGTAAGWLPH